MAEGMDRCGMQTRPLQIGLPPRRYAHPLWLSTHFFWSRRAPQEPRAIYVNHQPKVQIRRRFSSVQISTTLSSSCRPCISLAQTRASASLLGVKDGRLRDVPPRLPAFCDRGQLDRSGGCVMGHGSFPQHVGDGKHCLKMEFRCPGKRRKVGWWTRFALGMEHGGGSRGRQKQGAHHTQGRSVGDEPSLTAIYSLLLLFAPLRPPHQPSQSTSPSSSISVTLIDQGCFPLGHSLLPRLGTSVISHEHVCHCCCCNCCCPCQCQPFPHPTTPRPAQSTSTLQCPGLAFNPLSSPQPVIMGRGCISEQGLFRLQPSMHASIPTPTLFLHSPSNASKHITHD